MQMLQVLGSMLSLLVGLLCIGCGAALAFRWKRGAAYQSFTLLFLALGLKDLSSVGYLSGLAAEVPHDTMFYVTYPAFLIAQMLVLAATMRVMGPLLRSSDANRNSRPRRK